VGLDSSGLDSVQLDPDQLDLVQLDLVGLDLVGLDPDQLGDQPAGLLAALRPVPCSWWPTTRARVSSSPWWPCRS